jgi:hypothetical protein
MKTRTLICILLIVFVACDDQRLNFDKGIIPLTPVNFSEVNSSYDDYNSDLDMIWNSKHFTLVFSTNRNSGGNDFDFIGYDCRIESNLVTGEFDITAHNNSFSLVDVINSTHNELGPFFTHDIPWNNWKGPGNTNRFFYTTDVNGNDDIYYNYYLIEDSDFIPDGDATGLSGINTAYNEGYLSIHEDEIGTRETVYFCSDRDGGFDIYSAMSEEGRLIDQSALPDVEKASLLNSTADDKCPYISGDLIVFTSDREGGFGGFDLWYSKYVGQGWSAPENFGEDINTEYDEYRPAILSTGEEGFLNDLMIFSSNRPGGRGGFDLYYVGVARTD